MLDDTSEGRAVSAEVARMERRGVVVTSIEQGPVVRESSTWGWGRVPAELVQTTWVAHLGGAPEGATVTFRQKVWTFSESPDPRDAGQGATRWALEILPDSRETAARLKGLGVDDRDEAA